MSKKVALLNGSKVINIIVVEENFICNDDYVLYNEENPAYIDGDYIEGFFYPPQPFSSWTRNNGNWQPPTPMPTEGRWYWDETTLSWVEA
jgi:hypothetical protein